MCACKHVGCTKSVYVHTTYDWLIHVHVVFRYLFFAESFLIKFSSSNCWMRLVSRNNNLRVSREKWFEFLLIFSDSLALDAIEWQMNLVSLQYDSIKFSSTHSFERWYGSIESKNMHANSHCDCTIYILARNVCHFQLLCVKHFTKNSFKDYAIFHVPCNCFIYKTKERIVSRNFEFYWFRSDKGPFEGNLQDSRNTRNCK